MTDPDRQHALARDRDDPLGPLRDRFHLPDGTIYLDGNSLGPLPRATPGAIADLVRAQWGTDLIASWNRHDWIGAPSRLGALVAPLIGARPNEVLVCDTTSVNLFKLIAAALHARPGRRTILSEQGNFPTDLYMAQGVASLLGDVVVRSVPTPDLPAAIDRSTALVLLTHVHYRTGARHDIASLTRAAHHQGALILWDLSHSAGAVAIDLDGADADLAVGCGYKYLNGGPGAPAFLFVAERLQAHLHSPLSGWMGHADPFAFDDAYRPADGIARFLCGTPSIIAMAALESGLRQFDGVDRDALFAKSDALSTLLLRRMAQRCDGFGFTLVSPDDAAERGSHVSFAHEHAFPICQALIARGVIGDFRAPDVLRLGITPLTLRFVDIVDAVEILRAIMIDRAWDRPAFHARARVT